MAKVPKDIPIQFSDHIVGNGQKVFDAVSKAGQEGIIAKDGRSKYIGERARPGSRSRPPSARSS